MAPLAALRLLSPVALLASLLLASAPASAQTPVSAGDREVNFLLSYLNKNGFSTTATRVRNSGVPDIIRDAVANRQKMTLLAPRNLAWQTWSRGSCNLPGDTLLAQHMLPGNITMAAFKNFVDGFLVGTLTAVPVVKQQSDPLQVVITTGSLKILTLANVTPPPVPPQLRWIQVLSVDKVLNYPCNF